MVLALGALAGARTSPVPAARFGVGPVMVGALALLGAALAGPLAVATSLGAVYLVAGAVTVITATVLACPLMRT